jgi:hypothetical protein
LPRDSEQAGRPPLPLTQQFENIWDHFDAYENRRVSPQVGAVIRAAVMWRNTLPDDRELTSTEESLSKAVEALLEGTQ